jgi:hypothetical protein
VRGAAELQRGNLVGLDAALDRSTAEPERARNLVKGEQSPVYVNE